MMDVTREEALAEAYKRGIFPSDMKGMYEEAMKRGLVSGSVDKTPMNTAQQTTLSENDPSLTEKLMGGGWQGLKDFGQGLKQTGLEAGEYMGLSNKGAADQYTKQVEAERALYDQSPVGQSLVGKGARLGANILPYVAGSIAAAPVTAGMAGIRAIQVARAAAPLLSRMAGMSALGAATGATSFIPKDQSRLGNTVAGGAFGAAFPLASTVVNKATGGILSNLSLPKQALFGGAGGAGIGYGIDKANEAAGVDSNYTAGFGLLGVGAPVAIASIGKIANTLLGRASSPAQQEIIDMGKKYNVPVIAADVLPPSGKVSGLTRTAENIMGAGVKTIRNNQAVAAQTAAEDIAAKLKEKMIATEYGGTDGLQRLQKVAQGNSPRAASAQSILNDIENSSDDWNTIIKNSGNVSLFNKKLIGDAKYDRVSQLASQYGVVPKQETMKAIQSALQENADSILPDEALNNKLQTIFTNLQSKDMDYSQMREARSVVAGIVSDFYKGSNAAVGSKWVGAIQNLKGAIEKDMNNFAQTHGNDLKVLWKDADNFYRENVIPYKDTALAKAITNLPPDEIYGKFVKVGESEGDKGTGRAMQLYRALDDKGRAAVRYGMVKQALAKGVKPGEKSFSPAQFASEMERHEAASGVFFPTQDKLEIQGFTNLMRHIERSGQMNAPDTGVRALPQIIGALVGGGGYATAGIPGAAVAYGGTALALRGLLTTKAGRNLLISSSRLKPGSPQMDNITRRMESFLDNKVLQRSAVVGAALPSKEKQR